jgi:hypothetical protein
MPIFDWLFNRDRAGQRAHPRSSDRVRAGADGQRDALRTMGYDEGRDAVRPPPAPTTPSPRGPTAAPEPAPATEPAPVTEPAAATEVAVELPAGKTLTLGAADVKHHASATWKHIADQHGTIAWRLKQANEGVEPVAGATVYVPSAEEQLYADILRQQGDEGAAAEVYAELTASGAVDVLRGAREAASGGSGKSYGTAGNEGAFWASNPALKGASERRTVEENGHRMYRVVWASNFWKCNLFANEAVFRGGFEPSLAPNRHYTTAGRLHTDTDAFDAVDPRQGHAGLAVVFWSGGGSNSSHTGICGSMVSVSRDASGNDVLEFTFLGASTDRAREDDKRIVLKAGTNEIISGDSHDVLRFLRPRKRREDEA